MYYASENEWTTATSGDVILSDSRFSDNHTMVFFIMFKEY